MRLRAVAILLIAVGLAPAVRAGKVKAETSERTLTHEEELAAGTSIQFENLLGSVTLRPQAEGRTVEIEARVVAEATEAEEARELAEAVELRRVETDGRVELHVSFPDGRLFRSPKEGVASVYSKWLAPLFKRGTVSARYDDRAVEVGNARGALAIAVHLEVKLPMDLQAIVRQSVGSIDASAVRGELRLELLEGQVNAAHIYGSLSVTTERASVEVSKFSGESLRLETGSGDIEVTDVKAAEARLDSARGRIVGGGINVEALVAETGSGALRLDGIEPATLQVQTGSGEVELATQLKRTREASIRSDTGDVTLRIGSFASFELEVASESGSVKGQGVNVAVEQQDKNSARFYRGKGGAALSIQTESGDVALRPL